MNGPRTMYRMAPNGVTLESVFAGSDVEADAWAADGWKDSPEAATPQPEPAADKPE